MPDFVGVPGWWWIVLTVGAAAAQTARNAMQKGLTASLGTVGATQVRFLFGLPFAAIALAIVLAASGSTLPRPVEGFVPWVLLGALSQISATALMLAAMRSKSFVVITAFVKTEAIQVALIAAIVLAERLSATSVLAIVVATAGVLLMSWPRDRSRGRSAEGPSLPVAASGWQPALLGVAAGGLFALSAVGFKGAIVRSGAESFVVAATFTLVCGLVLQSALLVAWQATRDAQVLRTIVSLWRPSLLAGLMGAAASQMWFLAFALTSTAHVRTLGMVEILFAHALSHRWFAEKTSGRELVGIVLVAAGVLLLLGG